MMRAAVCSLTVLTLWAQLPYSAKYDCAESELQSAGLLCTEDEPCPIFLEINAIASAGRNIILAGDIHATSATLSSILLTSGDGGASWQETSPRLAGAALDQLQTVDADHAWAAGEVQYPLARDPFFVLSTDGGASWRKRDVTDEGGPGSVLRFWFDAPEHGELIVDAGKSSDSGRYLLYESQTGGESWTIRSTTGALPKLKLAPATMENQDFRVRPGEGGKTYQVERRLAGNWQTLSSLAIEIASCKVKPGELKEPQPVTDEPAAKDHVEELKPDTSDTPAAAPKTVSPPKKGPPN